jgi:transposase
LKGLPLSYPTTLEECHALIQELSQLVRHVLERVEELELENKDLRARLNANSNNSSKPPSSDFKKNKKPDNKKSSGKPSGGQPGHKGHTRQLLNESEVDEIVTCENFGGCSSCGEAVKPTGHHVRHQVHELPEIKLNVTEYRVAIGACVWCERKQNAGLPEGISWGITGPRLTSFMSELVAKYQLSRRNLQEFLADHFNFRISLGTVFNKQKLVSQVLEEPVNALLAYIKKSVSANIDETGHRQEAQNHWLWVVASKTAAYFKITKSRGKKVLQELLHDYEQTVISDRHGAYNYFDSNRQMCWSHLKRDFTRLWQNKDRVISRIGKGLLQCEEQLFHHWHSFKKQAITREELYYQTRPIVRAVGEFLEQGRYTAPELKAARFCKNLLERFSSLWVFLEKEGVEPTNNHAERCLRKSVIWRKKYFGTRSEYGSEYVARTASLNATAKLQKQNPFHYLSEALKSQFSKQKIPSIIKEPLPI